MDSATFTQSVKKTGRCVTVEEGWPQGSGQYHLGNHHARRI